MTVTLAPELEQLIAEKINSGRYASVTELLRDALNLLDERDQAGAHQLDAVRTKLDLALADIEAGRVIPGEEIWERLGRTDPR